MCQEAMAELEPVSATEPLADAPPERLILIVDDDAAQLEALSHRFSRQGFKTVLAARGEECLIQARKASPDVILLDLNLPDMDGLAVCERLADSPETCGIPIIILTGMERPDIVRSSRAAGCTYFIRKPYDPNALLTLIQHSIGGW